MLSPRVVRSLALASWVALASGCVGVLDGDAPRERGAPWTPDAGAPLADRDGGAPPADRDAGSPPVDEPLDAGAPTLDAGAPMPTPDAGASTPTPDAGAPTPTPDAGAPTPTPDAGAPEPPPPPPACASPIEAAELELTNAARRAAGLGELRCDEGLARAARLHSQDMCDQGYFDHDSLDGRTFVDRIDDEGVRWRTVGENIAVGYRTPEAVHEGWMNSDGHRRNILNGAFGRIGIGYVECGGRPYWTQDFAD